MNTTIQPRALMLLALNLTPAFAGSTVDLGVTGLITPRACSVSLSDSGLVDFGKIPARILNQSEFTLLPSQQMGLGISCEGPTLFALVGIDNQPGSSPAPTVFYGLGMNLHAPTERLGSVGLSLRGPVGDDIALRVLSSSDNGRTWRPEPNAYPGQYMGFARPDGQQPGPIKQLVASLRVETAISPANTLTLAEEVPLQGSITLDLKYL
jgi:hypothetical protein